MTLVPGSKLGAYEIRSTLGAGGMGEVYRARHWRLERDVAIKVLPDHLVGDRDALARFEREAKAVAALNHPNILAIHDFGDNRGIPYAVMELLEGETLRSRLSRSVPPWQKAVEVAIAVAEGLSAAHAKGIIHRDLKPENVFLTSDGRVKILDFGLARWMPLPGSASSLGAPDLTATQPGIVMGTLAYMSPEQARGMSVGAPSDIFSLGCVLYEMLVGRSAFARPTSAETIAALLTEDSPRLGANAGRSSLQIPADLERVVAHWAWEEGEQRLRRAIELKPDYSLAHDYYAMLLSAQGRHDEAMQEVRHGLELEPLSAIVGHHAAWVLIRARMYDEAIDQCREVVEMDPNFPMGYYWLRLTYGLKARYEEAIRALQAVPRSVGTTFTTLELARVYAVSGRTDEARQLLAEMHQTFERDYAEPFGFATVYAALGEVDKAFDWLERASQDRSGFFAMWVKDDPRLDSLRSDTRMGDLLRRAGFGSPNH